MSHPAQSGKVDVFLWDSAASSRMSQPRQGEGLVIDVTPIPVNEGLIPAGMFNQWPLESLIHISQPFTGLVVLIDMVRTHRHSSHDEGALQLVTACVAGLLGENDFGCRTTEDEFVMVCPGLEGAGAQRRLSQISEQLWEFHRRVHGTCSLLFSWGGVGTGQKPLSEAVAAAVKRMTHLNRNRKRIPRTL